MPAASVPSGTYLVFSGLFVAVKTGVMPVSFPGQALLGVGGQCVENAQGCLQVLHQPLSANTLLSVSQGVTCEHYWPRLPALPDLPAVPAGRTVHALWLVWGLMHMAGGLHSSLEPGELLPCPQRCRSQGSSHALCTPANIPDVLPYFTARS